MSIFATLKADAESAWNKLEALLEPAGDELLDGVKAVLAAEVQNVTGQLGTTLQTLVGNTLAKIVEVQTKAAPTAPAASPQK